MPKLSRIAPEIPVSNLPGSIEYYEQKLGFRVAMRTPSGDYAIVERGDIAIHLFQDDAGNHSPVGIHIFTPDLEALHADIIVLRHSSAGAPQFLANRLKASVINAGDGAHEHPTQALLDLYTIRERRGRIAGLHVAIIGDILFSRVARSNIFGLLKLGARVTLVGPSTLVPREFEKLGAKVSHKIEDVLPTADVVNLLRIQHERQRREYFPGLGEYVRLFGLTKERAKLLKPDCLIMHPGPINRGVEIDSEVADGVQSVILDQVTNGLAVRMAVLYLCGGISA